MYTSLARDLVGLREERLCRPGGPLIALAASCRSSPCCLFCRAVLHGTALWLALGACAIAMAQRLVVYRALFPCIRLGALAAVCEPSSSAASSVHSAAASSPAAGLSGKARE